MLNLVCSFNLTSSEVTKNGSTAVLSALLDLTDSWTPNLFVKSGLLWNFLANLLTVWFAGWSSFSRSLFSSWNSLAALGLLVWWLFSISFWLTVWWLFSVSFWLNHALFYHKFYKKQNIHKNDCTQHISPIPSKFSL